MMEFEFHDPGFYPRTRSLHDPGLPGIRRRRSVGPALMLDRLLWCGTG